MVEDQQINQINKTEKAKYIADRVKEKNNISSLMGFRQLLYFLT